MAGTGRFGQQFISTGRYYQYFASCPITSLLSDEKHRGNDCGPNSVSGTHFQSVEEQDRDSTRAISIEDGK